MQIEFDYQIFRNQEHLDDCYAFVELTEQDIDLIVETVMIENSEGELLDLPEKILDKFVDAAMDDALEIYPDFDNERLNYSIGLQKYLPDDLLDYIPDEAIENFSPEMFEEVEGPNPEE